MEKNWLIRTKSCHILGPVSREKVIELWQNGSIKPEDEICSGNGHWIWLRESALVDRYLMSGEKQDFNPICEAPTIFGELPVIAQEYSDDITLITPRAEVGTKKEPEEHLSSSTMKVAERTAELLKAKPTATAAEKVIRAPEAPAPARPQKREYSASPTPVTPGKQMPRRRSSDDPRPVTVLRPRGLVSDRFFMVGALVALIALAAVFYYRKQIISEFIQSAVSTVIPTAIAQDSVAKKKTSFLTF